MSTAYAQKNMLFNFDRSSFKPVLVYIKYEKSVNTRNKCAL